MGLGGSVWQYDTRFFDYHDPSRNMRSMAHVKRFVIEKISALS